MAATWLIFYYYFRRFFKNVITWCYLGDFVIVIHTCELNLVSIYIISICPLIDLNQKRLRDSPIHLPYYNKMVTVFELFIIGVFIAVVWLLIQWYNKVVFIPELKEEWWGDGEAKRANLLMTWLQAILRPRWRLGILNRFHWPLYFFKGESSI